MNVPPEAQAILRRMTRRGFDEHCVTSSPGPSRRYYTVTVEALRNKGNNQFFEHYEEQAGSVLAACRRIELRWKLDRD